MLSEEEVDCLLKKEDRTKEEDELLRKEADRLHELGIVYLTWIDLDEQEWASYERARAKV